MKIIQITRPLIHLMVVSAFILLISAPLGRGEAPEWPAGWEEWYDDGFLWDLVGTWIGSFPISDNLLAPPGATPIDRENHSYSPELGFFYDKHFPWVHADRYGWVYVSSLDTTWIQREPALVYLLEVDLPQYESVHQRAGARARKIPEGWYDIYSIHIVISNRNGMQRWMQQIYSHELEHWYLVSLGTIHHEIVVVD